MSDTTLNTTYFVTDSTEMVTLGLAISAPGQTSTSIISLDDIPITDPLQGDVTIPIKKNNALDGVVMQITTVVTDTSRESNHTGVDVSLTGGFSNKVYPLQQDVANEGDSVAYSMRIRFRQFTTR